MTPDEPGHLDFALESRTDFELGRALAEGHFANYAARHWNRDVAEADIENVYLEFDMVPESLRINVAGGLLGEFLSTCEGRSSVERTRLGIESLRGSSCGESKNSTLLVNIHQWSALLAPPVRRRVAGSVARLVVPDELSLSERSAFAALLLENGMEEQGRKSAESILRSGTRNGTVLKRLADCTYKAGLESLTERAVRRWVDHPTRVKSPC